MDSLPMKCAKSKALNIMINQYIEFIQKKQDIQEVDDWEGIEKEKVGGSINNKTTEVIPKIDLREREVWAISWI